MPTHKLRAYTRFRSFALATKMLLTKQAVIWQDKLGLYSYRKWIQENEPENGRKSSNITEFPLQPTFSYLVLWDGDSISILDDTLQAMRFQSYDQWHTTVLVSSMKNAHELPASPTHEEGIKFTFLKPDQDLFHAIVAAIRQVSGDYVQVLAAGDRLPENANEEIVKAVNESHNPPDIIYFDEDYLDPKSGYRSHPFFKPDWSPELLLSTNYILHAVYRAELLKHTLERESPSDLDHLVRDSLKYADRIHHIAKVLYHFGAKKRSELTNPGYKKGSLPVGENSVSIIIPTRDHEQLLRRCLRSILEHTSYPQYEIILVDNASSDEGTRRYYSELSLLPQIRIINYLEKFNFSRALNLGAQASQADTYIFLNNDVEAFQSGWLDELVWWANQPEIGIIGSKLLFPDGSIQHAGIVLGLEGHAHHVFSGMREGYSGIFGSVEWYRNYSAVTGACMAMRREVFEKVGGFDEQFRLAFGDVDICLRVIEAGYRVVYSPHARLIHHEGATRGAYIPAEDVKLGYERFRDIIVNGDPYFNPNLSYTIRVPTLKRKFEETPIKRLKQIVERYFVDNSGGN